MLEIKIMRFEAQDIITLSRCTCPWSDQVCEANGHPGCVVAPSEEHRCGVGED